MGYLTDFYNGIMILINNMVPYFMDMQHNFLY